MLRGQSLQMSCPLSSKALFGYNNVLELPSEQVSKRMRFFHTNLSPFSISRTKTQYVRTYYSVKYVDLKEPPRHTCGWSSELRRRPSKRRSGCRRRSRTVGGKWPPSRDENLAGPSFRPVSVPWQSITSSCAFSHTLDYCLTLRVWVFSWWAGHQMG